VSYVALTKSTMLSLGTKAPDFYLKNVVSGEVVSLSDFRDKRALLVMFICRHCPYVKHVESELVKMGEDYKDKNLGIVAISSNDAKNYPEDAPESLREQAKKSGFNFPYLYDETQEVAKSYTAACTPDFFLFDRGRKLVYRGQLDWSRPGNNIPLTGEDLRRAVDAVLLGKSLKEEQKPSSGCNVKWKA